MLTTMLRGPETDKASGYRRSTRYQKINDGLFPPPVKIGLRASAWPAHEVEAINRARMASKSDDEIRQLVKELVAQRKLAASSSAA